MQPIEIIVILLGLAFIAVSFFMTDRHSRADEEKYKKTLEDKIINGGILDHLAQELEERVNSRVEETAEEVTVHTDDHLSQISNEKIMSINEFSDQVLEKISQNHNEVVFLYDMLNEKEKDLKAFGKKIEGMKQQIADAGLSIGEDFTQAAAVQKAVQHKNSQESASKKQPDSIKKRETPQPAIPQEQKQTETGKAAAKKVPHMADAAHGAVPESEALQENLQESGNQEVYNNDQILKMHTEGKSVVEISKSLGLGQGEVKLVIDLFAN